MSNEKQMAEECSDDKGSDPTVRAHCRAQAGPQSFNKSPQKQSSPFVPHQLWHHNLIQYSAPHPHHVGNNSELVRQLVKEKKKKKSCVLNLSNLMLAFYMSNIKAFFHSYLIKINH